MCLLAGCCGSGVGPFQGAVREYRPGANVDWQANGCQQHARWQERFGLVRIANSETVFTAISVDGKTSIAVKVVPEGSLELRLLQAAAVAPSDTPVHGGAASGPSCDPPHCHGRPGIRVDPAMRIVPVMAVIPAFTHWAGRLVQAVCMSKLTGLTQAFEERRLVATESVLIDLTQQLLRVSSLGVAVNRE